MQSVLHIENLFHARLMESLNEIRVPEQMRIEYYVKSDCESAVLTLSLRARF